MADSIKVPDYLLSKNQQSTAENVDLFHSAERGDVASVRSLLTNGANPNFFHRPDDQKNALHVASENGHDSVVQCLLEHGAVANSIAATDQSNALNLATRNPRCSAQLVELLIDHGADPSHGMSCSVSIIGRCRLLPHSSSLFVFKANGYGNTPLHESALCGNLAVTEALLGRGVSAAAVNHKGSTPLHSICYSRSPDQNALQQIGELLLMSGGAIDATDKHMMTPLLVAVSMGNQDLLHWLLQKGANVNARDDTGRNAAEIARFYEHHALSEELLRRLHK